MEKDFLDVLKRKTDEVIQREMAFTENLLIMYMKETGLKPSEIKCVRKIAVDGVSFWFEPIGTPSNGGA